MQRYLNSVLLMVLTMQCCNAGEVIVTIKKSPKECAPLMVALFDSQQNFLNRPVYKKRVDVAAGAVVKFSNIPAGLYAASAFCDNNHNGDIDKASFGRPIEPYGISRDAKGHMGPPRFEDASFVVGNDPVTVPLMLR